MSAVAAIDCGTNSIRLLIAEQRGERLDEICREVRLARLGQDVDKTREFHPDALERTFAICDEFAELIASNDVSKTRFVATSAARDVKNRQVLFDGVMDRLGVAVDVITGDEEARLSASGVLSGVGAVPPVLIFDIGGGSTELVTVQAGKQISHAVSLDVGAVRIKERFFADDPPTMEQQLAAHQFVTEMLESSGVDFSEIETAVGVAGTVTTTAAAVLGLETYDRQAVHRTRLTDTEIQLQASKWLAQPVAVTEAEPLMHPLRASVIAAGALILSEISTRVPSASVMVSESDILDGIALELVR